jgi:hypothetical protein
MKIGIVAAVVSVSATLLAGPALAQEAYYGPGPGVYRGQEPGPGPGGYYDNYGYRSYDEGPVGVAGDIVGGAIGTAGAIATAPFRAAGAYDSYAMDRGGDYCAQRYRSYDPQSGTFMGYDGRRHPCQ